MPNHIHGIINIVGVDPCIDPLKDRTFKYATNDITSDETMVLTKSNYLINKNHPKDGRALNPG